MFFVFPGTLLCRHSRGQWEGHPLQMPFYCLAWLKSFGQVPVSLVTVLLPVHLGIQELMSLLGCCCEIQQGVLSFLTSWLRCILLPLNCHSPTGGKMKGAYKTLDLMVAAF